MVRPTRRFLRRVHFPRPAAVRRVFHAGKPAVDAMYTVRSMDCAHAGQQQPAVPQNILHTAMDGPCGHNPTTTPETTLTLVRVVSSQLRILSLEPLSAPPLVTSASPRSPRPHCGNVSEASRTTAAAPPRVIVDLGDCAVSTTLAHGTAECLAASRSGVHITVVESDLPFISALIAAHVACADAATAAAQKVLRGPAAALAANTGRMPAEEGAGRLTARMAAESLAWQPGVFGTGSPTNGDGGAARGVHGGGGAEDGAAALSAAGALHATCTAHIAALQHVCPSLSRAVQPAMHVMWRGKLMQCMLLQHAAVGHCFKLSCTKCSLRLCWNALTTIQ
jgi:hypothetical protein